MNKHKLMIIVAVVIYSNSLSASQYCPKDLKISKDYVPPQGWHVTYYESKSKKKVDQVIFHISEYNYDHKKGENSNSISCFYRDRENTAMIEITTNQANFPSPSNTGAWQQLDPTSLFCFPIKPVDPTDCPWG